MNDLVGRVPPADYEEQLGRLVRALRRGGDTTVLVGNVPSLPFVDAYDPVARREAMNASLAS